MPIDFYCMPIGAPSRAVLLAAKAIGVELNVKVTDLRKGEHLTPEFIKLNPQHCIPTLDDNGFAIWESRVIMTYLQEQYGKDESLYPKNPKKRALVDQRLYFDLGTLYSRFAEVYYPIMFANASLDQAKAEKLNEALQFLDTFLSTSKFAAGDNLTLADFSLVATVSTIEALDHDLSPYKNIAKWYDHVKAEAPGYEEANEKNVLEFKQWAQELTKK